MTNGLYDISITRSNNKRGLRFHIHHAQDKIFDLTKKTFGITIEGVPGDEIVCIDSFRIKNHYQRFGGWGSAILQIICEIYQEKGTHLIKITNPTAAGRTFYIRNNFVKQDWLDLHLYCSGERF